MKNGSTKQRILLHSCCAPCLCGVIDNLTATYEVAVFWYNPNIWPKKEHDKRYDELIRYGRIVGANVVQGNYQYADEHRFWLDQVKGFENEPEKGKRCQICYRVRLAATAYTAFELNHQNYNSQFELFGTELSISPHKDADLLNQIGPEVEMELRKSVGSKHNKTIKIPKYLPANFKKTGGFKRSVELSKQYQLYRQSYCGCEYSSVVSL